MPTFKSLLRTTKDLRQETLRQVYAKPLHFYLTGDHVCGCDPYNSYRKSPDPDCMVNLQMIRRLPFDLNKWSELVVHFVPFSNEGPRRDNAPVLDYWLPINILLAAKSYESIDLKKDAVSSYGSDAFEEELLTRSVLWQLRHQFKESNDMVLHYPKSLATTLRFLAHPREEIDIPGSNDTDNAATYQRRRDSERRLHFHVSFDFQSHRVGVLEGLDDEMPLWTLDMIHGQLTPWRRLITKCNFTHQVKLPGSFGVTISENQNRIRRLLSDKPGEVAQILQQDFENWFYGAPLGPMSLLSKDAEPNRPGRWYSNTALLEDPTSKWGPSKMPVLLVSVPEPTSGDRKELRRWQGQFFITTSRQDL